MAGGWGGRGWRGEGAVASKTNKLCAWVGRQVAGPINIDAIHTEFRPAVRKLGFGAASRQNCQHLLGVGFVY